MCSERCHGGASKIALGAPPPAPAPRTVRSRSTPARRRRCRRRSAGRADTDCPPCRRPRGRADPRRGRPPSPTASRRAPGRASPRARCRSRRRGRPTRRAPCRRCRSTSRYIGLNVPRGRVARGAGLVHAEALRDDCARVFRQNLAHRPERCQRVVRVRDGEHDARPRRHCVGLLDVEVGLDLPEVRLSRAVRRPGRWSSAARPEVGGTRMPVRPPKRLDVGRRRTARRTLRRRRSSGRRRWARPGRSGSRTPAGSPTGGSREAAVQARDARPGERR